MSVGCISNFLPGAKYVGINSFADTVYGCWLSLEIRVTRSLRLLLFFPPLYFGDFCHTARESLAAMCQHRNKNLVPGSKCLFGMAGQCSQQPTLSHSLSEDLRKGACVPCVVNGKGKQTVSQFSGDIHITVITTVGHYLKQMDP